MYECLAPVHGHQYTLRKIYECLALVHAEEDVRMPGTCTRHLYTSRCPNAWHLYASGKMYERLAPIHAEKHVRMQMYECLAPVHVEMYERLAPVHVPWRGTVAVRGHKKTARSPGRLIT